MMDAGKITVNVGISVDESTARAAASLLEIFLRDHPDHDLRVVDMGDGTSGFRVVRKDEPCGTG